MILYFSGTGNSKYVARRIGSQIRDEVVDLFDKLKNSNYTQMHSECPWVVVVPTYAWRIPRIVQNWLEHTNLTGNREIYFVMTCGVNIGNAGKYLKKLCADRKLNYCGCTSIVMPENYIAMFTTPDRSEAMRIIENAERIIDQTAQRIQERVHFPQGKRTFADKISSGMVNNIFYPMFVNAKKFLTTDACISCGKCVQVCPMSNVRLKQGKPEWGERCTHCMACINGCPNEAIEYGKHSRGLPRYICPKQV